MIIPRGEIEHLLIRGAVLTGGACRDILIGVEPKDYDLFFLNKQSLHDTLDLMLSKGWKTTDSKFYTITLEKNGLKVQLVFKDFFEKPEDVYRDFDYVNVMACVYSQDEGLTLKESFHPDFKECNEDKVVKINVITKTLASFKRLCPYMKKGYDVEEAYDYIVSLFESRKDEKGVLMLAEFYE